MKRDQLPLVVLDGRHAAELLAHPCAAIDCPRYRKETLGEHIWRATLHMAPGPPAQSFDARVSGSTSTNGEPDIAAIHLHTDFHDAVLTYWRSSQRLIDLIGGTRPDRTPPVDQATDDDWCRLHLNLIGKCEPVYRRDLCRWCYDFEGAEGFQPTRHILFTRHRGERITTELVAQQRPKKRRKRRRRAG